MVQGSFLCCGRVGSNTEIRDPKINGKQLLVIYYDSVDGSEWAKHKTHRDTKIERQHKARTILPRFH